MSSTQKFLKAIADLDRQRTEAMEFLHKFSSSDMIAIYDDIKQRSADGYDDLPDEKKAVLVLLDVGYWTFVQDVINRGLEEEREEP